jgi:hypothetical protein
VKGIYLIQFQANGVPVYRILTSVLAVRPAGTLTIAPPLPVNQVTEVTVVVDVMVAFCPLTGLFGR